MSYCVAKFVGNGKYIVAEYHEGFGLYPVFTPNHGTEFIRKDQDCSAFDQFAGKRFPTMSAAAYRQWLRENYPTTGAWMDERDNEALSCACL